METFGALMSGFAVALTLKNLMWGFVGVTLGTAIGVLPGVGPALTIALLLPATASLDPTGALIMFAGIYYGAMYGGSTTSILLNTPGESATIVTALEGNHDGASAAARGPGARDRRDRLVRRRNDRDDPAHRDGADRRRLRAQVRPGRILRGDGARVHHGVGGARRLGGARSREPLLRPRDRARSVSTARPARRGSRSASRSCSTASTSSSSRSACSPSARRSTSRRTSTGEEDRLETMKGSIWMSRSDWKRSWKPWLRGTALGFPFGTIPAGGAEIPTFLSYAIEKKLTKHPEEFGKGAIEGVAGPEAANNASATGTLVPLLTLGLPTTATAAIILAAFQQWGLQPGPLLFETQPLLIWGLIASMYVGNVILLILNLPLVGIWVKLLEIPRPLLYAGILIFATLGAYGLRNSWFDLALLVRHRRDRLPDAPLRHSGGAGAGRDDPRAARRAAVPPRARDQPGRPDDLRPPADFGHGVRDHAAFVLIGPPLWRPLLRPARSGFGAMPGMAPRAESCGRPSGMKPEGPALAPHRRTRQPVKPFIPCSRRKNSARVSVLSRSLPRSTEVVMSDACSRTPRCVTHMCSALTTTATPSAEVSASTQVGDLDRHLLLDLRPRGDPFGEPVELRQPEDVLARVDADPAVAADVLQVVRARRADRDRADEIELVVRCDVRKRGQVRRALRSARRRSRSGTSARRARRFRACCGRSPCR